MIRYQKSPSAPSIRPGRKGLISVSTSSSLAADSTPSRRNSALNPISKGSPVKATGSVSRDSPTSCV